MEIGDALEDLGFRVRKILDADHATLLRGLTGFLARGGGAHRSHLLFWTCEYIERGRGEYLIPVDSRPTDGGLDRNQGVPLDLVLWAVQPASNLRLVIMDAQHSEPPKISSGMLFVAYAGRPGERPNDGPTPVDDDKEVAPTSPYTWALLRHLRSPDAGGLDGVRSGRGRNPTLRVCPMPSDDVTDGVLADPEVAGDPAVAPPAVDGIEHLRSEAV